MSTMTLDDDEVRALESRLRQNGWTDKVSDQRLATKKRRPVSPPPTRFGGLDGQIKAAALQLVSEHNGYSWPTFGAIAEVFGFSYDDAVRALSEAKRLSGADL
jgi:hypothetical protein